MSIFRRLGAALLVLVIGGFSLVVMTGLPIAGGYWLMGKVEEYPLLYWPVAMITGMLSLSFIIGAIAVPLAAIAALCQSDTSRSVFRRYP